MFPASLFLQLQLSGNIEAHPTMQHSPEVNGVYTMNAIVKGENRLSVNSFLYKTIQKRQVGT